jgi:hypothetical protein
MEVVDDLFRKHSGMLAPGKDYPVGSHPPDDGVRREAHERWFQSGQAWFDAIGRITVLEDELRRATQDLEDANEAARSLTDREKGGKL